MWFEIVVGAAGAVVLGLRWGRLVGAVGAKNSTEPGKLEHR